MGPKRSAQNIEVLPPIKVLIVEDNPINVKILSTFLRHRKIKFGVARDGREAVQEWEAGGYHLILMDIQLPIMDGIEATKEIRRLEQMANIGPMSATTPGILPSADRSAKELGGVGDMASKPTDGGTTSPYAMLQNSLRASVIIVALTASVLNSDRVAALAAGCNDFLNKPVDLRWLERKVIEWGSMQYLISFREWPNADGRTTSRSKGAAGVRKTYLAPTQSENARSDGQVDRAFNAGPDKLARELAGRLYIGGKKPKTESTAPTSAGQDASPVPAGQ
jgi:osomolarity two-component system response regulator SSK1